jgi:hypothetical protein
MGFTDRNNVIEKLAATTAYPPFGESLGWYRRLIAQMFDGSRHRIYPGRPRRSSGCAEGIAAERLVQTIDNLVDNFHDGPHRNYPFGWCCRRPSGAPSVHDDPIPNDGSLPSLAHSPRQQAAFVPILLGARV